MNAQIVPLAAHPVIPDSALETHVGVLGKTGAGKSYTARGLVERLLANRRHVVVIDPTGAWWGLRTGFDIPIFGGRHGDIEISDATGAAVAGVIVDQRTSAIVDLSLLSGAGQRRFMRDFAHRLRAKEPGAFYLVIDEADEFLPQNLQPDMTNLFGDLKWMVRRGRLNGFRVMMITQRPAEIAKAVLTQIETLVAHRLTAPQDRKAIEEWVKGHHEPGEAREVLTSLASLDRGEAWVWSPDLGILTRSKMPPITTFDSGRTPEPGEAANEAPKLGQLDFAVIRAALAQVDEPPAKAAKLVHPDDDEVRAVRARLSAAEVSLSTARAERDHYQRALLAIAATAETGLHQIPAQGGGGPEVDEGQTSGVAPATVHRAKPQRQRQEPRGVTAGETATDVPAGCAKPLAALAAVFPSGLTEPQWATAAGYKRSGGTWGTYKSRLRAAGLIEVRDGRWFATEAGASAVGDVEMPPPPGPDLVRWWAAKLPGTAKMAEALIDAWPGWIDRHALASAIGMTASGGSFGTYLSRLAGPGLIDRSAGGIRLSCDVMTPSPNSPEVIR